MTLLAQHLCSVRQHAAAYCFARCPPAGLVREGGVVAVEVRRDDHARGRALALEVREQGLHLLAADHLHLLRAARLQPRRDDDDPVPADDLQELHSREERVVLS